MLFSSYLGKIQLISPQKQLISPKRLCLFDLNKNFLGTRRKDSKV